MIGTRDAPFDLVVAGAGPAGLATAICAAPKGLRVVVLETRSGPVDKACGEGIMPNGVAALEAMGVVVPDDESRPFHGVRYVDGDLVAEGRFRGGPGLGVRRTVLVRCLLERCADLGIDIRFGSRVESWTADEGQVRVRVRTAGGAADGAPAADEVCGGLLIGADGLHSVVRRRSGLAPADAPAARGALRYGVRRHFAIEPWADFVEVHLNSGAEAYVTPVGPRTVGVALLFERGRAERNAAMSFETLLSRFPALERRLAPARALDDPRGAGPFRQPVRARAAARVALVGDAAGYADALTGQGLELAFAAARELVDVVAEAAPLSRYETAWRKLTRRYYIGTGLLLWIARRPRVRRNIVRLLARLPGLFDLGLDILTGPATAAERSARSARTAPERSRSPSRARTFH